MADKAGLTTINENTPPDPRIVSRIITILMGATGLVILGYSWVAWQINSWQLWAEVVLLTLLAIVLGVGLLLVKRGRPTLAGGLAFSGTLIVFLGAGFLIADFGLILGVLVVFIASIVALQTLPPRQVSRAILISLAVGTIILVLDFTLPDYRLTVPPQLQTFIPIVGGVVLLIYGYYVLRQFRHYSLRTKLIIVFIGVSILSIGLVSYFSNQNISRSLEKQVGTNLHGVADSIAVAVGAHLFEQVEFLRMLSADPSLGVDLQEVNAKYLNQPPSKIQRDLQAKEQEWQTRPNSAEEVPKLTSLFALRFDEFTQHFPNHLELLVTDQYGALAAAADRPLNYYYGRQAWWQAAYNNGRGSIYISQPEFDLTKAAPVISMAVPIYAADKKTVVGILYSKYRLASLAKLLEQIKVGETGQVNLLFPAGQLLSENGTNLLPVTPDVLSQLNASVGQDYANFVWNMYAELGEPETTNLVSQAGLRTLTDEPTIKNLNWKIVVQQQAQEAFSLVTDEQDNLILFSVISLLAAAVIAVIVAQRLSRPIINLTQTAQQVASGNLQAQAQVETGDEVGQLAEAFNLMTQELRDTIDSLEQKVSERTSQLETVVAISQRLTGILDLDELLRQIVALIIKTFHYYHVHIYLLEGDELIVAEGYGEAGAAMKRSHHSIPLAAPQSLVARAARHGKIITVENVRDDPNWLPNPLLPDTHAEMAVPIILNQEIAGVLDVQSEKTGGLTQEDESTLQLLANQIATALRNARLFTETQSALTEAQRLQQLYTGQAWEEINAIHPLDYEFHQDNRPALPGAVTPEATLALQQKQTVQLKLASTHSHAAEGEGEQSALATPLKLRDQIIGILGIHSDDPNRQWSRDEIALIETVSEQMSLALENARLFEDSQRSAWRDQTISESTAKVWSSTELEEILRAAVAQLGDKLRASEVVIRLGAEAILLSNPETV